MMEPLYLNTSQIFRTTNLAAKNALIQKGVTTLGFGNRINITRGIADYGINVALVTKQIGAIRFTN